MVARVVTVAFEGVEARRVDVEVQMTSGTVYFAVVGLGDKAVAESRERVRSAFTSLGLALPAMRIVANLAPADLPKEGSHYDLPIALAIMAAMGIIPADALNDWAAVGELGLDGQIAPVPGALPAAVAASAMGLGLICPEACGPEAAWVGDCRILAPRSLISLVNHFRGLQIMSPPQPGQMIESVAGPDLRDVKGQEGAKRPWRSPRPAATTCCSSARPAPASPCWPSACRAFCRRCRRPSCSKPRWSIPWRA